MPLYHYALSPLGAATAIRYVVVDVYADTEEHAFEELRQEWPPFFDRTLILQQLSVSYAPLDTQSRFLIL